jgi:hypothetical protein
VWYVAERFNEVDTRARGTHTGKEAPRCIISILLECSWHSGEGARVKHSGLGADKKFGAGVSDFGYLEAPWD